MNLSLTLRDEKPGARGDFSGLASAPIPSFLYLLAPTSAAVVFFFL
jgi:hypothetical protein